MEVKCISLVIRNSLLHPKPKQSQKSRSIFNIRFLGLFTKGKTHIIAKLHRANLVIFSHIREGNSRLIAK